SGHVRRASRICERPDHSSRDRERAGNGYPSPSHYPGWYNNYTDPFYATRQYDQVITMVRRITGDINLWTYMVLAMSYAQSGRPVDAAAAVTELLLGRPAF